MIRRAMQALLRVASISVAFGAVGCGKDSVTSPPPPVDYDAINPIVYSQHVQPIWEASCNAAACHNSTDHALGVSLASYADVAKGGAYGSEVLPYHPDRSHLVQHMTGALAPRMPLATDPVDPAVIRLLNRWIADGAKNDDGKPMYSDVASKAFVACQGDNALAVLDLSNGLLIREIDVRVPHSVYVDVPSRRVYVSRFETASDNIRVYDGDTLELVTSGEAGTYPALMKITPDQSQLWVTNFDQVGGTNADNAVHVLDPVTLASIAVLQPPGATQQQPHGLAMTADGSRVYVTNILTDNVTIFGTGIPGGSPSILDWDIRLPSPARAVHQPQQCALSKDEKRLFVSALLTNRVYVLNVDESDAGYRSFTAQVTVGSGPWNIALSPDGNELWVANWTGKSVSVVDVSNPDSPMVVDTLTPTHPKDPTRLVLLRPIGIGFSPDGRVWVSCPNDDGSGSGHHPPPDGTRAPGDVVVFDRASRAVLSVTEVPFFARFASFLP
ncbi:MAG: beta-propeller fold lactonase family protein [bacterium]